MLIGYARISKADGSQSLDLQRDALREAGVSDDAIYEDQASGQREDRPGLAAFLKAARQGDVIVVWRLDRLGRNLRHLVNLVQDLNDRDIGIRVLAGQEASIDTTTASGKLVFALFAALAEFERELIRERTLAGLASVHKHVLAHKLAQSRHWALLRTLVLRYEEATGEQIVDAYLTRRQTGAITATAISWSNILSRAASEAIAAGTYTHGSTPSSCQKISAPPQRIRKIDPILRSMPNRPTTYGQLKSRRWRTVCLKIIFCSAEAFLLQDQRFLELRQQALR